jgi:phosphate transport system protein
MSATPIRRALMREENEIRDNILRLGNMVESAIERSITALQNRDQTLAQQVILDDQAINELRYRIEEACLVLIATQQPAASDLRVTIAATHIAVELERMADHAVGIAKLTLRMIDQPLLKPLIDVPAMARITREMIRGSLDAFVKGDPAAAHAIAKRDDEVDQLDHQVFRELLSYMLEDPANIQRATFLLWVSHNLERIADRVTNVCERVIFMSTGVIEELNG